MLDATQLAGEAKPQAFQKLAHRLAHYLMPRDISRLFPDSYFDKWQPVGESNPSFQVENLAS